MLMYSSRFTADRSSRNHRSRRRWSFASNWNPPADHGVQRRQLQAQVYSLNCFFLTMQQTYTISSEYANLIAASNQPMESKWKKVARKNKSHPRSPEWHREAATHTPPPMALWSKLTGLPMKTDSDPQVPTFQSPRRCPHTSSNCWPTWKQLENFNISLGYHL